MSNIQVFTYTTLEQRENAIFEQSICTEEYSRIEFVGTPEQSRELIVNMQNKYGSCSVVSRCQIMRPRSN